jgi:hypothetical protein
MDQLVDHLHFVPHRRQRVVVVVVVVVVGQILAVQSCAPVYCDLLVQ